MNRKVGPSKTKIFHLNESATIMQAFQQNHLEYKLNVFFPSNQDLCPTLVKREEEMVFGETEIVLSHKVKLVVMYRSKENLQ